MNGLIEILESTYRPISRELYDSVERVCQSRYCVLVEMKDGSQLAAIALMARKNRLNEEFLCVGIAEVVREIRLDRIDAITLLEKNSPSGKLEFAAHAFD
jgi:transcriptional antiterminator Rof (Rho-off)